MQVVLWSIIVFSVACCCYSVYLAAKTMRGMRARRAPVYRGIATNHEVTRRLIRGDYREYPFERAVEQILADIEREFAPESARNPAGNGVGNRRRTLAETAGAMLKKVGG